MNATATLYTLYCTNIKCKRSVFNEIEETRLSLTKKNILATHICRKCLRPLVSMIDVEIAHVLAKSAIKLPQEHNN